MSSHKNKNRNKKKPEAPARDLATEKLTEQLNADDEEPKNSAKLLAEFEKQEQEAAQRKAERERAAERESAEKAKASVRTPESSAGEAGKDKKPEQPKPEKAPEPAAEEDVKQFVPRAPRPEPEPEKPEESEKDMEDAFAEDPEDMSEESEPGTDSADAAVAESPRPNRFYLVFAIFVIVMSVIGIVSTVQFCAEKISDIANRTDLKNELTLFLYPIVSVDPPDCDTVDELPSTIIIESAIWRIILTGDTTNYEKLNTYMYVPAIDVEFSVRSIYGTSVNIVHQTVGTMDISFRYVPDINSYFVPINPHYTAYSPRITELTNVGELYTVTVEYIPPSALAVEGIEFEVSATKTMVYTLSKSKNTATLHSIKNITRIGNSYEY